MRTDTVPEIGYTREAFNRTVAHAAEYNVSWVIPWIALGCGYRRVFDSKTYESFEMGWNYECASVSSSCRTAFPLERDGWRAEQVLLLLAARDGGEWRVVWRKLAALRGLGPRKPRRLL